MRPLSRVLALAASVVAVACFELSGPTDGIVSISSLIADAPSVAVGDVMRDEVARPAPLQLFAFDVNGDTIKDVGKRFVRLDSSVEVSASGVVRGLRLAPTGGQIVGQVADADHDTIQTPILRVIVVEKPTSVLIDNLPTGTDAAPLAYSTLGLTDLPLFGFRVGHDGAPVASWLVRFYIDRWTFKTNSSGIPPVRLVRGTGGTAVQTDTVTTNAEGLAQLRLQVVSLGIDTTTLRSGKIDTVDVRVSTVWYPPDTVEVRDTTYRFILQPRPATSSRLAPARARPVY